MKIFVLVGEEERGPYTKSEVFALMKDGSVPADTLGRWEQESEWKPINKILAGGSLGLFSAEEIAKKQEELPEPVPFVADFLPPRQEVEIGPPPKSRKVYALALVAIALAVGSGLFLFHAERNDSVEHADLATQSTRLPANAIPHPESTPHTVARKSPLPPSNSDPSSMQSIVTKSPDVPNSASDVNALEKQPILAESSPQAPPQAAQPPLQPVAPPQPTFQTITSSIELSTNREITGVKFWVSQPVESPQGVLVLCLERRANAEATAKAPIWLDFAKSQNLALIAFTPSYAHPEKVSAEMLFDGLARAGLGKQPLLVYGLGEGGTFVSSLVNIAGNRIQSWAVFTNTSLHTIPYPEDKRPALIGCDYEVSKINHNLLSGFESGRDRDLKWTWLTVAGSQTDRISRFETFVRSYFAAILSRSPSDALWVEIDTLEALKFENISTSLKSIAWLPDESLISAWTQMMPTLDQRKEPIVIRKSVATRVKSQPSIEMFLRLPPQFSKEHPLNGTLAFCTWEGNPDLIQKQLLYRSDMQQLSLPGATGIFARLIRYAEQNNLALLTWTTRSVWNNGANNEDLKQQERRQFDLDFDKLANSWERGLEAYHRENGIPDTDMLLYGISRGGQWAHRLALRKSEHFFAVHAHIPSSFDSPTESGSKLLWLLTTGELDSGYERAIRFYQECRKMGYYIIFKAVMGEGHSDTTVAENLGFRFFDFALQLQRERLASADKASNFLQRRETLSIRNFPRYFSSPPFIGDFLNQEMYPRKDENMIPSALQVPLPTEQLAQAWDK